MPGRDPAGVDLNAASQEELEKIAGIGGQRAKELVRARPIQTWEHLRQVPGFTDSVVEELKEGGAILGDQAA